jgi:hypothetical protein
MHCSGDRAYDVRHSQNIFEKIQKDQPGEKNRSLKIKYNSVI